MRSNQEHSLVSSKRSDNTENRILEAAVQIFARHGYNASGTLKIAQLAGVNEITVFRHFSRKKDLFWAAVESQLQRVRISEELRNRLDNDENPGTAIPAIVTVFVDAVRQQPETIRLLYSTFFELDCSAESILREHLVPLFKPVLEYLARCAAKGSIRNLDPGIAALGIATLCATHQTLHSVITPEQSAALSTDDVTAVHVDFWLKALMPKIITSDAPGVCLNAAVV
jgi:AcrR family transcriptional regulator